MAADNKRFGGSALIGLLGGLAAAFAPLGIGQAQADTNNAASEISTSAGGSTPAAMPPTQEGFEIITEEDAARIANEGNLVLLHYGEGFSEFIIKAVIGDMEQRGYKIEAYQGGPNDAVMVYIDNARLPRAITEDELTSHLASILNQIGNPAILAASDNPTLEPLDPV